MLVLMGTYAEWLDSEEPISGEEMAFAQKYTAFSCTMNDLSLSTILEGSKSRSV